MKPPQPLLSIFSVTVCRNSPYVPPPSAMVTGQKFRPGLLLAEAFSSSVGENSAGFCHE